MTPIFVPLSAPHVAHWRAGGPDANGQAPEARVSDGQGVPCRFTLRLLPAGAPYLVLAHRPFAGLNAYTETGPIFVTAEDTPGAAPSPDLPSFLNSPAYVLRGYDAQERIVYGTGRVVPTDGLIAAARDLFTAQPQVAFAHVRSATNGCFHVRVERGG